MPRPGFGSKRHRVAQGKSQSAVQLPRAVLAVHTVPSWFFFASTRLPLLPTDCVHLFLQAVVALLAIGKVASFFSFMGLFYTGE